MELFESWKQLVTAPNKWLSKNKGPLPLRVTVAIILLIAVFSSTAFTSSEFGSFLRSFFKLGAVELFAFCTVYLMLATLLSYAFIHQFARWLGGKGSLHELISIPLFAIIPISFASTMLFFVPYVGKALSALVALFSLVVIWIIYKVLRLRYKLSVERSLAAFFGGHLISGTIMLLLIAFVAYSTFMSFVESGAYAPTVTPTAGGYHLYSATLGGYSFDYGSDWELFDWGGMNGSAKLLSLLMQNDFISSAALENKEDSHSLVVFLFPQSEGSTSDIEEMCSNVQLGETSKADLSEARGTAVQWGNRQGCMMENIRDKKTGELQSLYTTFECGGNSVGVIGRPGDYQAIMQIASTLKCGKDAVK